MSATIEVRAPSEQSEGTRSQVQRWLKSIGDTVVENEPLIEVETDKVTIEIPSPASGVLHEILKHETDRDCTGSVAWDDSTRSDVYRARKSARRHQERGAFLVGRDKRCGRSCHISVCQYLGGRSHQSRRAAPA